MIKDLFHKLTHHSEFIIKSIAKNLFLLVLASLITSSCTKTSCITLETSCECGICAREYNFVPYSKNKISELRAQHEALATQAAVLYIDVVFLSNRWEVPALEKTYRVTRTPQWDVYFTKWKNAKKWGRLMWTNFNPQDPNACREVKYRFYDSKGNFIIQYEVEAPLNIPMVYPCRDGSYKNKAGKYASMEDEIKNLEGIPDLSAIQDEWLIKNSR